MASKIKKNILDELQKTKNILRKAGLEGSTKYALLEGLYNQVSKQESDTDVVNTVWANKDLPLRMFTEDEFSVMPGMKELMIGEPRTGEVNLEKSFGSDWKERFNEIPYNHIALVAEKNGVDPKLLLNTMRDEKIKSDRREIAHSGAPGLLMSVFGRRQQEAIERGESPSWKDKLGDIGEGALYAIPYGRAAAPIKNLVARRLTGGIASVVAPPLASETMDAAMYDDQNQRGNFSVGDVGSGIATNLIVPRVLRGAGRVGKVVGVDNRLATLAEGQTAKELAEEQINKFVLPRNLATKAERQAAAEFNKQSLNMKNVMANEEARKNLVKLAGQKGNTLEEKAVSYMKSKKVDPSTHFVDRGGKIYEKLDPNQGAASKELYEVYDKIFDVEGAKTARELAGEEALKNLLSNKFGDQYAEENSVLGKVPIIGNVLQRKINISDKEEKELQKRREIEEKYKFMFGGLR